MRRWLNFPVEAELCAATLDDAPGATGLLIVSGGNEIRCGAHRGMARLAAIVADAGYPVLRFDRRGIGDSEGENGGFEASAADIAAATALLRASCPAVNRIVAFGNCDAASALALHHRFPCIDALILANPWTIDEDAGPETAADPDLSPDLPAPAAIRARYLSKLRDPGEWLRLISGDVSLTKLLRGLRAAGPGMPSQLGQRMANALTPYPGPITILLASRDTTAQAFIAEWRRPAFASVRARATIEYCETASHSFADEAARQWLTARVLAALR